MEMENNSSENDYIYLISHRAKTKRKMEKVESSTSSAVIEEWFASSMQYK